MKMRKRYRIISKTRFIVTMTLILLIFLFSLSTIYSLAKQGGEPDPVCLEINVRQGDTLWQIAKTYGPADADVRQVVYEICRLNNISPEDLRPGQLIKVPASP